MLDAWRAWRPQSPPYLFEGDRGVLSSPSFSTNIVLHPTWDHAIASPDFCATRDRRLHLGLIPQPFIGDIRNASIYVLLLNPGLGPHDYFGEHVVPEYRAALLANLRQDASTTCTPFLFLDPRHSWHGGFRWWHGKLVQLIERLRLAWGVSFAEARLRLARRLASIELVPYHSARFALPAKVCGQLDSVKLARQFVQNEVLKRVQSGEAIVIVARKAREWNLPDVPGVVTFSGGQARGAHLTPESRGGREILKHLLETQSRPAG
jgi:hypothetical protein